MVKVQHVVVLATVMTLCSTGVLLAADNGQPDLDKALQVKLNATTIVDLGDVIRLSESALKKGLDQTNTEFAKRLLASALMERAKAVVEHLHSVKTMDDLRQGRKNALADLDKAAKLDLKQPEAYVLMARLAMLPGGTVKEARDALDKAFTLPIDDPTTRGQALLLRGIMQEQPEKKLADLNEAVKLVPDDAETVRTRGELLARLGKTAEALADFNKAIELEPEDVSAYENKIELLDKLKKYDDALAALKKVQKLQPGSVEPLLQRAVIHTHQQNLDAALEDLGLARSLHPDNVGVLLLRASIYQQKRDKKKAAADVDEAMQLRPDLPSVVRTHALLLADDGRLNDAAAELEKLVLSNPDDTSTLLQLAALRSAQERPEAAVKTFTAVLTVDPTEWQAFRGRGDAYLALGRHTDALADYEKALKLQPNDEGVLNNLAWLLATSPDDKLRDGHRALRLAKEASEASGYKAAYILSTLAAASAETGDFQSAVKWSSKAVEIGEKGQSETLKKELDSYKAKRPWRELLSDKKDDSHKSPQKPKK